MYRCRTATLAFPACNCKSFELLHLDKQLCLEKNQHNQFPSKKALDPKGEMYFLKVSGGDQQSHVQHQHDFMLSSLFLSFQYQTYI
jgi:hypothetical protein